MRIYWVAGDEISPETGQKMKQVYRESKGAALQMVFGERVEPVFAGAQGMMWYLADYQQVRGPGDDVAPGGPSAGEGPRG